MLYKCIHLPVARTFTDIFHEVINHLRSFCSVKHFRMELDRIQLLCLIFSSCHRTVCRMCCDLEARCNLGNIIKMAHPADCLWGYSRKYFRRFLINQNFCLSILSYICTLNFSTKHMGHELCSIAKTKHWNTKLEKLICISR